MFNNKRKTIGVFLNRAEKEYQGNMSSALIKYAREADCNILFFTSYEIREVMNYYDIYGSIIIDLAPLEDLDGVIIALDTYDKGEFRDKLISSIKKRAKCPVVSFREISDDFYNVTTEVNSQIEEILEHLYEKHGYRDIAFMAGYEGHYDSNERLKIYKEFMASKGLKIHDNSIFYGDLWKYKGQEALEFFMSDPARKPDAVVCANDTMARSLMDAAYIAGIKVPEELAVTGVDNEAITFVIEPKITTIGFDIDQMSKEAIGLIRDVNENNARDRIVRVPANMYFRESCGCPSQEGAIAPSVIGHYCRENEEILDQHALQNYFMIDMGACGKFDDILKIISDNIPINGNVSEFYLCLLGERDEFGLPVFGSKLSKKADLVLSWKDGKVLPQDGYTRFDTKDILPSETAGDGPLCYYITMLHDSKDNFGFTVVNFKDIGDTIGLNFHEFNLTIGITVARFFMHKRTEVLLDIYEKDSLTDYLTGMNNRRGGEHFFELNKDKWIKGRKDLVFMSVDLDYLKQTNDTYGHEAGDTIIKACAQAIRKIMPHGGCCIRMGGDEFLVAVIGDEEFGEFLVSRFFEQVRIWNEKSNKPYRLSVSAGFYSVRAGKDLDIHRCIRRADQAMYQFKTESRRQRTDEQG
ncbi:MAG: GGDEF domain-containing protein [Clostridiales bacterium]|nr:GGDEF domain-containing protein [Clostridiales bacterium]